MKYKKMPHIAASFSYVMFAVNKSEREYSSVT